MEQVSGWAEQGGSVVTIPGTQGSGVQRFQQSFRGATVTVRDSSNNLATIYSDDLATPTAKANPFTASSTTGSWSFFTTTGTYSLTFSGGSILAPFSITVNVGLGNAGGVPSYAFASLPTSKSQNAGDLARVTNTVGGLWMDSGTRWAKQFPVINVQDAPFNARGDGVTDDAAAINAALLAASTSGSSVFIPPTSSDYRIGTLLDVPAGVLMWGVGRKSKLQSTIGAGVSELVRLTGDYATIRGLWLNGTGRGSGASVDGSRGVWIGLSNASNTRSDYCTVEDCIITEFGNGNGLSGAYWYAKIINNEFINNTDANIFIPPLCSYNLVQGNIISGSRYSGIDCNGSNNRIVDNLCISNGGGVLDTVSWCGIVLANIENANPCVLNLVKGNRVKDNLGCGILVFGCTGAAITPAYGNVVEGNISTGHTNTAGSPVHVPAGISSVGGDGTIISGNYCYANRDNYFVSGGGIATSSTGVQLLGNQSQNATRDGYLIIHSPRVDLAGDFPPAQVQLVGNFDRAAGRDSFRFTASTLTFNQFMIAKNRSLSPTGYCFNNSSSGSMFDYDFDDMNYGSGAGTAYSNGFGTVGLTVNSATPSVANGRLFITQNSAPTTITNFTSGVVGQIIFVHVNDAFTTLDFTSSSLKGHYGADLALSSGDFFKATYNGTSWYCDVNHLVSVDHSVTQLTDKSTAVTLNWIDGTVTMNNAALAADTTVDFTLNNSTIAAADLIVITGYGGPNRASYNIVADGGSAGSTTIHVRNITGGSLSDAVVFGFSVIKQ